MRLGKIRRFRCARELIIYQDEQSSSNTRNPEGSKEEREDKCAK